MEKKKGLEIELSCPEYLLYQNTVHTLPYWTALERVLSQQAWKAIK